MLGRYRIERELGRGGMGVVYVATDVNTDRLVALKTTSVAGLGSGEKTRNQRRERFVREVRALTQVNHPNVVHVFDAGEIDDADLGWLLFYTMEYVEGTTLAALVQERGALNGGEAAAVVAQVAHGLGEAHKQGIIHRDVKPANIFLSNDGRALIGDFGIAKIEGSTQITRRDQLVGTPNYLAPEQILGEAVGPFTDVFALGALFYVITQNRPLRQQVDAGALLASANGNDPVARIMAAADLSDGLKRVVGRALERDPNRRYIDGSAFADALADHATRVPTLSGQQARPSFLNEGTQDRSSAFLNSGSLPSADEADVDSLPDAPMPAFDMSGTDAGSVEAMAMAMLGEVARRSTGTYKQPERKDAPAELPVARTESTVMFNIRALEESAPPPTSPSPSPLPVARTESTQVVKRTAITMEPITDESDDASGLGGRTLVNDDSVPPGGQVRAVRATPAPSAVVAPSSPSQSSPSPTSNAAQAALNQATMLDAVVPQARPPRVAGPSLLVRLAALPRQPLMAATFVVGGILGLSTAIAVAPEDVLKKANADDPFTVAPVPIRPRPALCPVMTPTAEQQAQGAQALDEARTLRQNAERPSAVVDKLREGIAADPTNHQLFYELGRVSDVGRQMDDADECVCQVAPESPECRKVEKARGR